MAKTLGEKLDEIEDIIFATQKSQSYQTGDNQLTRADLRALYAERDKLLNKISIFGRQYIEGQNTQPLGDVSYVSFV